MQTDWIAYEIGALRSMLTVGFEGVHRRIDDREAVSRERHRQAMGEIRHLRSRMDKKRNGGMLFYTRVACALLALIFGVMANIWPKEAKQAGLDYLRSALERYAGNGG